MKNGKSLTPVIPANGEAMALKPGMNLTTRSEGNPCRAKILSVTLLQTSGSIEILQSRARILVPCHRPNWNQIRLAAMVAMIARAMMTGPFSKPVPAKPPAAIRKMELGSGRPACSKKTTANTTISPLFIKNCKISDKAVTFPNPIKIVSMKDLAASGEESKLLGLFLRKRLGMARIKRFRWE